MLEVTYKQFLNRFPGDKEFSEEAITVHNFALKQWEGRKDAYIETIAIMPV